MQSKVIRAARTLSIFAFQTAYGKQAWQESRSACLTLRPWWKFGKCVPACQCCLPRKHCWHTKKIRRSFPPLCHFGCKWDKKGMTARITHGGRIARQINVCLFAGRGMPWQQASEWWSWRANPLQEAKTNQMQWPEQHSRSPNLPPQNVGGFQIFVAPFKPVSDMWLSIWFKGKLIIVPAAWVCQRLILITQKRLGCYGNEMN